MELKNVINKIPDSIKKYRYVVLVLIIGLILMIIPDHIGNEENPSNNFACMHTEPPVSEQLKTVLQKIDGAGNVDVMLTILAGEQVVYQTDQDQSVSGESNSSKLTTIILTDAERNQEGLVKQIIPPTYMGAIVVCEGADSPTVRLAIVEAVSKITGLGTDRICVLKMK